MSMTNLLEKALLTGFGIFTLMIFVSIINPFINNISEFNNTIKDDIENYHKFFIEIDSGILFVLEHPNLIYLNEIDYPSNLNITLNDNYVKYTFLIENEIQSRIFEYTNPFISCEYSNILASRYLLNITCDYNYINLQIR